MVAGPETVRLLTEYDEKHPRKKKEPERHHEQMPRVQNTFLAQTKNVTDVIEELGNPFADTSADLYTLDSKLIMKTQAKHSIIHLLWSDYIATSLHSTTLFTRTIYPG